MIKLTVVGLVAGQLYRLIPLRCTSLKLGRTVGFTGTPISGPEAQLGITTRVIHVDATVPSDSKYSLAYQKVHAVAGSTSIDE